MTVGERVAAHYQQKAARAAGTVRAYWYNLWAEKALAGHQNPLTRRLERMARES